MIQFKRRHLGALEKVFWLLDQTSQVHFVMSAEINSRFSVMAWRAALDAVQQRHPLFSVAIESNGYVQPVFVKDATATQIPLRIVNSTTSGRWEAEMEMELANPFDWSAAPLVRAVLVQEPASSVLIMAAHHSIADGISMSFVMRDTLQALAGNTLGQLTNPQSIDELLMVNGNYRKEDRNSGDEDIIIERKTEQRPQINKSMFSPALIDQIVGRAKAEKTTVHGALSAALVIAARKLRQDWKEIPVRMVHPVSIRDALKIQEDVGLYITSKIITYEPGSNMNFWELARYTKNELKNSNSLQNVQDKTRELEKKVFNGTATKELSDDLQKTVSREMMLSNLGRLNYSTDFGSFLLKGIWGPLALSGYPGDQTIGVSTIGGILNVMHVNRRPIRGLLQATIDELLIASQ